jgi:hypothetical protein
MIQNVSLDSTLPASIQRKSKDKVEKQPKCEAALKAIFNFDPKAKTILCNRIYTVIKNAFAVIINIISRLFECCFRKAKVSPPSVKGTTPANSSDSIAPKKFDFNKLPEDIQLDIFNQLDGGSILSFYRATKSVQPTLEASFPIALYKLKDQMMQQWKAIINPSSYDRLYKRLDRSSRLVGGRDEDFLISITKNLIPEFSNEILQICSDALLSKSYEEKSSSNDILIDMEEMKILIQLFNLCDPTHSDLARVNKYLSTVMEKVEKDCQETEKFERKERWDILLSCCEVYAFIAPQDSLRIFNERAFLYRLDRRVLTHMSFELTKIIKRCALTNFEQTLRALALLQPTLRSYGAIDFLRNCHQLGERAIPFIQQILNENSNLAKDAAIAYARIGAFELCREQINIGLPTILGDDRTDFLSQLIRAIPKKDPRQTENFLDHLLPIVRQLDPVNHEGRGFFRSYNPFISIAKAYKNINPQKTRQILDEMDLTSLSDYDLVDVSNLYISTDIEKAKVLVNQIKDKKMKCNVLLKIAVFINDNNIEEIKILANQIENIEDRCEVLLRISNFIKNQDIVKAKEIWEMSYKLHDDDKMDFSSQLLINIEITQQKIATGPDEVQKWLEKIKDGSLEKYLQPLLSRWCAYNALTEWSYTCALVDPVQAERLIKRVVSLSGLPTPPLTKARMLMAIIKAINDKASKKVERLEERPLLDIFKSFKS